MRRNHYLNHPKNGQQGFALFIVLMMMVAIALLVVAAMQSYNTEQRISTNDADRKLAFSLAESALREGEGSIVELLDKGHIITFNENCEQGLCRAKANTSAVTTDLVKIEGNFTSKNTEEAWQRKCTGDKLCIDENGKQYPQSQTSGDNLPGGEKRPRYILEYIGTNSNGAQIFRVTAKAWGKNSNTVVIVQSYVSNE